LENSPKVYNSSKYQHASNHKHFPPKDMRIFFTLITIGLYLAATTLVLIRLKKLAQELSEGKINLFVLWSSAILLHAAILFNRIITPGGLNLQFFNALSIVSLLVAAILLIATFKHPLENLAIVVLPTTALSLLLDQTIKQSPLITEPVHSVALQLHILISLLAFSLLSIAVLQALLLAIQDRHLHNHHPGGLIRALPPLQLMENLLFQLITVGFLLLSLALLTGFIFLDDIFAQHLVHKTVLSCTAWLIFAVLLWGRWQFGWRGRIAIRWTLWGGILLMFAYFGSKLVLELILHRT
jgi:ABC-type uncharacterized transport system permease subunit